MEHKFKHIISACAPLIEGEALPKSKNPFEMVDLPCKCGITHKKGDDTYEFYDLKMVTDDSPIQVPPRKTARCKTCKETLLVGTREVLEKMLKKTNPKD